MRNVHPFPLIWIYELPAALVRKCSSPSGQNVLQTSLAAELRASPHHAQSPSQAHFFYLPVPIHWGGKGRAATAALLSFVAHTEPWFNASLMWEKRPNHLLLYSGDLAMDTPPTRRFSDTIAPAIDVASPSRHFIALTLTGNPETGFQVHKDIVLPPCRNLKGGPSSREACCGLRREKRTLPHALHACKARPSGLRDSPWRRRPELEVLVGPRAFDSSHRRDATTTSFLLSWAGQATGGGMGRHGGSGPRVRSFLASISADAGSDVLITDTNNDSHRQRNVERLPAEALVSTDPGHSRYGFLRPVGSGGASGMASTFCVSPFGRGNGWEGRSASAIREGCLPLSIAPIGTQRAFEPLVPWNRFALLVPDEPVATLWQRLRTALSNMTPSDVRRMRCELACAATHMSWGSASRTPPASCAAATSGSLGASTGVGATLMLLLGTRLLDRGKVQPRPCPCHREPSEWFFFSTSVDVQPDR